MEDFTQAEITIDEQKVSIQWERRKVYNNRTVQYYGEKIIGSDFIMEDYVYIGCTADGQLCIANKDFSKVEHLGDF